MPDKINKYKFLIDGGVHAQALARTLEEAEMRVKRLFKGFKKFVLIGESFHHNVGEHTKTPVKKSSGSYKVVKSSKPGEEGIDSVVEAYGRHSKIEL